MFWGHCGIFAKILASMVADWWCLMTTWEWYLPFQREDVMTIGFFAFFVGCRLLACQQESGCIFAGFHPSSTWPMRGAANGKAKPSRGAEKRKVEVFTKQEAKKANERTTIGEKREAFSRVQERSQSPHREGPHGLPASSALRKVLKAHTKRKQLSTQRLRKNAQRMRASIGEKSLLEAASIKVNQRLDYAKRLEKFYSFAIRFQLPLTKIEQLDEALCEYADHEYLNGEAAHCGEKLQAALEYERPEFSRAGALHLPRFRRCMKGWRKMAPTQTRLPMPEFMKSAISAVFLHQDFKEEALYNEVTFSTYSRPGEMLKVHAMDVVPPNRDFEHCVIVLGPMERGESSKVGIYDEVLILDDVRCPCMVANPATPAFSAADQPVGARSSSLEFQCPAVPCQMEACCGASGLWRGGNHPISEQTWWCEPRSSEETAECGSYPTARSVGLGQLSPDLRQARANATGDQSVWQQPSRSWGRSATQLQHLLPEWHTPTTKTNEVAATEDLSHVKFLSLFGGVGEASKFVARCGGVSVLVDWDKNPLNDLSKPSRWSDVGRLLKDSNLVGIDLPCPTWSRARRAPRWSKMPSPLRDDDKYIWGLPDLTAAEEVKVAKANHMTWGALRIIRRYIRLGILDFFRHQVVLFSKDLCSWALKKNQWTLHRHHLKRVAGRQLN